MDDIFEFVAEIFGEFFFEILAHFSCYVAKGYLPKKFIKRESKDVKAVIAVMSVAAFAALIASVIMLIVNDGKSVLGIVLLTVSALYFIIGLILAVSRKIHYE